MNLQSHYLANTVTSVHEGEKPWIKFDCSYCDKKFQKAEEN